MNPHPILYAALGPLVGGRYHINTFPQRRELQTWPAIRGSVVTGTPFPDQCGTDDGETDDVEVQLDVVATDYDELVALAGKGGTVRAALANTDPPCRRQSYFETFDEDTKTHRAVLSYVFAPSSTDGSP